MNLPMQTTILSLLLLSPLAAQEQPATGLTLSGPVPAATSLAASLPADTVIYIAIPDVAALRRGFGGSAMGSIYGHEETQSFLAGGLAMLDEGWGSLRGMAAGMGVPEELTHWDALKSLEFGFALSPKAGLENPFSEEPNLYLAVRAELAEGVAVALLDYLSPMAEMQGFERITADSGDMLVNSTGMGGPPVELRVEGNALFLELAMGERGEGMLAETAVYKNAMSRVDGGGAAMVGYMNVHDLWDTMMTGLSYEEPEMGAMLLAFADPIIQPMESISFASGWEGGTSFTNFAVCLSDDAGELWSYGAADLSLLDYIPADSTAFAVADNSSARAWARHFLTTLDALGEMEMSPEITIEQMALAENADLHAWLFGDKRPELDAVLGSIGARAFSYGRASGMTSESISFTEVTDSAALGSAFEQLMPRLREVLQMADSPVQLQAKRVKRRVADENGVMQTVPGPPYYSLDFGSFIPAELASFGLSVQPTMAVTEDGWMAYSMTRGPVRNALTKGVQKPEQNIRSNSDVQGFLSRVPEGAISMTWNDPRPPLEGLLGLALGLAPMASEMVSQAGMPFDLNNLPGIDVFINPLVPTETIVSRQGGDLVVSARGSFGLADMLGAMGACASLAPVALMVGQSFDAEVESSEPVLQEF